MPPNTLYQKCSTIIIKFVLFFLCSVAYIFNIKHLKLDKINLPKLCCDHRDIEIGLVCSFKVKTLDVLTSKTGWLSLEDLRGHLVCFTYLSDF